MLYAVGWILACKQRRLGIFVTPTHTHQHPARGILLEGRVLHVQDSEKQVKVMYFWCLNDNVHVYTQFHCTDRKTAYRYTVHEHVHVYKLHTSLIYHFIDQAVNLSQYCSAHIHTLLTV